MYFHNSNIPLISSGEENVTLWFNAEWGACKRAADDSSLWMSPAILLVLSTHFPLPPWFYLVPLSHVFVLFGFVFAENVLEIDVV